MLTSAQRMAPAITQLCLVVGGVLLTGEVHANMAPRWWGDRTAEPPGFKAIAITDERLTIDLRPLAGLQHAHVEAIYHLSNPGPACKVELFFLAGAPAVEAFEVRLGERAVESKPLKWDDFSPYAKELPESWTGYAYLPGIEAGGHCLFHPPEYESTPIAFSVELPTGASTLTAHYSARACGSDEGAPTTTWQFPYLLAPAKRWGSFGRLEVTVSIPPGWEVTSTPALRREGDNLRGTFDGLPADTLHLATRMPLGADYQQAVWWVWPTILGGFLLGGVIFLLASWGMGCILRKLLSRRGADPATRWFLIVFLSPVMAMLWAIPFGVAFGAARERTFAALRGQENPFFHERAAPGSAITAFLLGLMLLVVGCLLAVLLLGRLTGGRSLSEPATLIDRGPADRASG
jgi:hypothetical protein